MPLNPVDAAMRPGTALTSNKYYFKGKRSRQNYFLMLCFDLLILIWIATNLIALAVIGVVELFKRGLESIVRIQVCHQRKRKQHAARR